MQSNKFPEDLKKAIRNKIVQKTTQFLILGAIYSLAVFLFGKFILHTENTMAVWVLGVLGVGILAVILRLPFLLTDKTFGGTVSKAIVKTEDVKKLTDVGLGSVKQQHTVDLIITTPDGKTHYKNIRTVKDTAGVRASLDRYKEGDTVFHLSGTPYTILLPKESDTSVQCAVCGRMNHKTIDTCEKCGHTLIKDLTALG